MSHMPHKNINTIARSATLHCLTGCAIGEILGLVIGAMIGLTNLQTIVLAVILAFIFGFSLSALPLMKVGLTFAAALSLVVAADTLSIATMELVDNAVMAGIPGAMEAGLVSPLYWVSMSLALVAAFFAAYPVNLLLLKKGKGHAIVHEYMETHGMHKHGGQHHE
jgi:hypothetical protein